MGVKLLCKDPIPRVDLEGVVMMSKKILVVEDSESYRSVLKSILAKEGYDIFEASSGTEVLESGLDKQEDYDLILLDFRLKDMTALDILQKLDDKTVPKLIISGEPAGPYKELVKPYNVLGWLIKPCDLNALKTLIANKIFA